MSNALSVIDRDDTLLGVCFALGEDFGFNPLPLRIGFALLLFWNAPIAMGVYAALGGAVALARWLAPEPIPGGPAEEVDCVEEPCEELPLAA
jgi:phage shock protein C